jgi:hypothetical protein
MWVGKILDKVDSGIVEELHASIVVLGGIDSINTNGVDTKLLEQWHITSAACLVGERIGERIWLATSSCSCTVCGDEILLICNTLDEELGTVLVEEVGAL